MQIVIFVRQLYPTTIAENNKNDGNERTVPPRFPVPYIFHRAVPALLAFRAAIATASQLTWWNTSYGCEDWEGLTCDSNGFVTRMWACDSESGCVSRGYACMWSRTYVCKNLRMHECMSCECWYLSNHREIHLRINTTARRYHHICLYIHFWKQPLWCHVCKLLGGDYLSRYISESIGNWHPSFSCGYPCLNAVIVSLERIVLSP